MIRVLMVCLGNICRSPMAEAVFRARVREAGLDGHIEVASCGTGTWHLGERPHSGTLDELRRHGLGLDGKRSQHVGALDLERWDYVVAMDRDNVRDLGGRGQLLLDFAAPPAETREVPDPYYVGGFGVVYRLVDAGARGLLAHICAAHGLEPAPPADANGE